MKRRSEIGLAFGLLLALAPSAAQAYCRTAACDTKSVAWQVCTPADPEDCGTPLYWPNRCVGYTLQKDGSAQVGFSQAEGALATAFATWMNADCGGGAHPSIELVYQGPVACKTQEYNKEKGNANIVMFRDDDWPYGGGGILALTTVTYSTKSGEIYDADMELNSENVKSFTIGDADVGFDLLSVATHEVGHFLGIAHSPEADATMFTNYQPGTTTLRDLSADDVAAICAAYPPEMPKSDTCDAEPRHGFSEDCAVDQPDPPAAKQGCAVAGPGAAPRGSSLSALGLVAALGALTSRRRRTSKRG